VRNRRRPTRSQRVLIVSIRAESQVQLAILSNFVAIQLNTETRRRGHRDLPVLVFQLAARDDVILQMMIMGVSSHSRSTDVADFHQSSAFLLYSANGCAAGSTPLGSGRFANV